MCHRRVLRYARLQHPTILAETGPFAGWSVHLLLRATPSCSWIVRICGVTIMIRISLALGTLCAATAALAQTPPPAAPRAAPEPSAYCRSAAQALFQGGGEVEMAAVSRACRRGDTIAINSSAQAAVFQVGRLCDFTKSIVSMGPQIVCVLAAERGVR